MNGRVPHHITICVHTRSLYTLHLSTASPHSSFSPYLTLYIPVHGISRNHGKLVSTHRKVVWPVKQSSHYWHCQMVCWFFVTRLESDIIDTSPCNQSAVDTSHVQVHGLLALDTSYQPRGIMGDLSCNRLAELAISASWILNSSDYMPVEDEVLCIMWTFFNNANIAKNYLGVGGRGESHCHFEYVHVSLNTSIFVLYLLFFTPIPMGNTDQRNISPPSQPVLYQI